MIEIDTCSLQTFCELTYDRILAFYGARDSCIFSAAVVCDVLNLLTIEAVPLRVEAAVFPADGGSGCILGGLGDGTRIPAAAPGSWRGHLASW